MQLQARVHFSGRYALPDLPGILQQAGIAVLPFDTAPDGDAEGLGLTIVEAQGCELPVVCADVPAVRNVIDNGVNGLLVAANDPRGLADAIIRLLEDRSLARRLATCGRELALQRFDWKVSSTRYQRLLTSLID